MAFRLACSFEATATCLAFAYLYGRSWVVAQHARRSVVPVVLTGSSASTFFCVSVESALRGAGRILPAFRASLYTFRPTAFVVG